MELGTLLPLGDIGGSPTVLKEYAQAAEDAGYDFIEAPDHVLGVNAASRPGWDRNSNDDLFHDPFVLFGSRRRDAKTRLLDRRADPPAAPDRACRQAGGVPRRAVRRPVPPGCRGR
ncbi:MAG TPA: hypothetical protein VMI30_05780, partial [Stellaceae bacterium]|nr:hypothetical protein [Stellaceae bacterium]